MEFVSLKQIKERQKTGISYYKAIVILYLSFDYALELIDSSLVTTINQKVY